MAALDVFKEVGRLCDREIVAMDILPILWSMSFGPLLGLEQVCRLYPVITATAAATGTDMLYHYRSLKPSWQQ